MSDKIYLIFIYHVFLSNFIYLAILLSIFSPSLLLSPLRWLTLGTYRSNTLIQDRIVKYELWHVLGYDDFSHEFDTQHGASTRPTNTDVYDYTLLLNMGIPKGTECASSDTEQITHITFTDNKWSQRLLLEQYVHSNILTYCRLQWAPIEKWRKSLWFMTVKELLYRIGLVLNAARPWFHSPSAPYQQFNLYLIMFGHKYKLK
jgi:hypothetical protein